MPTRERTRYVKASPTKMRRLHERLTNCLDDKEKRNVVIDRFEDEVEDWREERAALVERKEELKRRANKVQRLIDDIDAMNLE